MLSYLKSLLKTGWIRLTPDRFVLGLLGLEALLLLFEWRRWFPFNDHKGWAVLIGLAVVGVGTLCLVVWFGMGLIFRCRFQFTLRTLLTLMVVVAFAGGWYSASIQQAREHNEAVEAIKKAGGVVIYDSETDDDNYVQKRRINPDGSVSMWSERRTPGWLHTRLGDDFFSGIYGVEFDKGDTVVVGLQNMARISEVDSLTLYGSHITDADLVPLRGLPSVKAITLDGTSVTGRGLDLLATLPHLRVLWLRGPGIDDDHLAHVKNLSRLTWLILQSDTITDTGIRHLESLTDLRFLDICCDRVTAQGFQGVQRALPHCSVVDPRQMNRRDARIDLGRKMRSAGLW